MVDQGRPCSKNLGLNAEDEIQFSNVSNLQIVMDFVKEIEAATGRKLTAIDIGGGLSSTYKGSKYLFFFSSRSLKWKCVYFSIFE